MGQVLPSRLQRTGTRQSVRTLACFSIPQVLSRWNKLFFNRTVRLHVVSPGGDATKEQSRMVRKEPQDQQPGEMLHCFAYCCITSVHVTLAASLGAAPRRGQQLVYSAPLASGLCGKGGAQTTTGAPTLND